MDLNEAIRQLQYLNGYIDLEPKERSTLKRKMSIDLAIKVLEDLDDMNHKVYRNENCARAGKCYDYIGYHCAGCNGVKEADNENLD